MPRRTANIPESQRGTVKVQLRLEPEAVEVLDALAAERGRSEYVGQLILDDGHARGLLSGFQVEHSKKTTNQTPKTPTTTEC